MIDFACKKFDIDEIIKCGLGITRAEARVMEFILSQSGVSLTAQDISDKTGLDLTTVQKAAKKLSGQKIVLRGQVNLQSGGYVYTYRANRRDEIRRILKEIIRKWSAKVEEEIDKW